MESKLIGAYFDPESRLPVLGMSCEEVSRLTGRPVYRLSGAGSPPPDQISEMMFYLDSGGGMNFSPSIPGGGRGGRPGGI